ncbi:guanine nucleotide-binding protein G(t) subunit alpha-1-like [Ylistrum balloti]|uniref:guanine nucleotide-binding protein G(t) subunit alpha-1-like n=1 Tax=Ylistrum balloti TaxID=509963 RepID=UPI002905AC38|nr:guanine nucleotide-binding protein G(t) subunit alpha-1-like [Ylistrum balloti]
MGCGGSRNILLTVQQEHSRQIDISIAKERKIKKLKFLLLGDSGSGKTTLFKQMRILHKDGFCLSERMDFKAVIIENLLQYTEIILQNMAVLNIAFDDQTTKEYADKYLTNANAFQNILDFRLELKCLYNSGGFQACMKRGQEYCLGDGAQYLFRSFDRIASPDYVPTDQDILCARVTTSGVTELNFDFKGKILCMVDVGGQTSERRKWIHCFDNVTAVIFVTAMNFYFQIDDLTRKSKLLQSLALFRSLCRNKYLSKSAFVLFLNKIDVFQILIKRKTLQCCFPEYKGDNSFSDSSQYICNQFITAGRRTDDVYCHLTKAIDTENFDRIFNSTMAILLNQNLEITGLL